MKICHMTSAHNQLDDRIFLKECQSLCAEKNEVWLVAPGATVKLNGVNILGCGHAKNRIDRIFFYSRKVYKKAIGIDADIYHFHDSELLLFAKRLKKKGKIVIFDSHEDVPAQIMDKDWIPIAFRKIISKIYKKYETRVVGRIDSVITATPHIAKQFENRAQNIVVINNYPKLNDIEFSQNNFAERESIACYIGGVSRIRGEEIMLSAMSNVSGKLIIAGNRSDGETINCQKPENVSYIGAISRTDVNKLLGKSRCGVVLYQPASNHYEAQPIKMFEYMAAGIPVVASNYSLWRQIIEENNCGVCVDPKNVEMVSFAINELINNTEKAEQMGKSGRKCIEQMYNWSFEEKKLLALYSYFERKLFNESM